MSPEIDALSGVRHVIRAHAWAWRAEPRPLSDLITSTAPAQRALSALRMSRATLITWGGHLGRDMMKARLSL